MSSIWVDNKRVGWRMAAATVLMVLAMPGCSPSLDWREARPADGLTLLFPCKPDTHVRPVAMNGASQSMSVSSCSADGRTFALGYLDVSDIGQLAPVLQAMQQSLADKLQAPGAPALRKPATVPGATPHPLSVQLVVEGRRPDGRSLRADSLFFCRGLRVYQATMIGERADAQALDTFFSSLKLSS
jgi:hypothetical protein